MRPDDNETRFELVPFFHGKILDVSEGSSRAFPHFISHLEVQVADPCKLGMFAGQSLDGVFSSYLLHLMGLDECKEAISEWARCIKPGGHIMLHLPTGHSKEQWSVSHESVIALMESLNRGWDLAHVFKKDSGCLFVFQLVPQRGHTLSWQKPRPEKTCAVVRYGAFGDCIQASSILPWLREQGYHITFYASDHGYPVIQHDPHIDRFIIQGRDEVPPQVLGDFWEYERKKYDKWVNLSESVEGTLLPGPGTMRYDWPDEVRAKYLDVNYLEFTHELAQVPPPYRAKVYSTIEEKAWARKQANQMGRRNVIWSLSGSSVHKTWPHMDAVIARIMLAYPDTHVILVGDELSQMLEAGWARPEGVPKNPRVHCRSGKWSIRESMAFAEVADLIIGTETGLLNAAGLMGTPKIVTLSHSSEEMLTKHWINSISLSQPKGIGCPMQPCRRLHTSWKNCMKVEIGEGNGSALCMDSISAEQMWEAVTSVLGVQQRMVA